MSLIAARASILENASDTGAARGAGAEKRLGLFLAAIRAGDGI